ncbi:sulfate adenylyltransferase [Salinisphaera japonica]|uniref:Sulfate adenylyltransferase n=1 Tax=Salinisphaera japonica YTM-1 TaxID=1209778 RepID=A0A423PGV1_9GAMM|nr:sulfate adenylyltransferase [Salinisphaera japonica]ROO24841.1 sulfate adenylyltransferase [Salinisphaera japonica YTM-1]
MIKPHGSDTLNPLYVADEAAHGQLVQEAAELPAITVSSAAAANAVMLGAGYFNPLTGYMTKADALSVARDMRTASGLFWPIPVVNIVADPESIRGAARIALKDPNVEGEPVIAVQDVEGIEEISDEEMRDMVTHIFGTDDEEHPGVATFKGLGRYLVHGPIQVLNFSYFETDFRGTFRTAQSIRDEFAERGWDKVVAFQTRNPMHRAHEELCKMALEGTGADGILIHMLLGKLKPGDIPARVRNDAIRTMVDNYFPENSVMITGYGFDMMYAGPREAVLHAVFRQNAGCAYLIVGRDHAGVGDFYGAFEAQTIFDEKVPADALEIEIFKADHTAFSKKLGRVVMMSDAPDHTKDDFVILSGTKVREMLGNGIAPPPEFSRPEVAEILMDYYQSK